jgi:DNA topoisomerase-2
LIITEGDSAKPLAMAGRGVLGGAEWYGVYPIRGKLMNVRD